MLLIGVISVQDVHGPRCLHHDVGSRLIAFTGLPRLQNDSRSVVFAVSLGDQRIISGQYDAYPSALSVLDRSQP